MTTLPAVSPGRNVTPRRDLVSDYKLRKQAFESKLQEERENLKRDERERKELEQQRRAQFRRDIEAQIEEQKNLKDTSRLQKMEGSMQSSPFQPSRDDVKEKKILRSKAREALAQSEKDLQERRQRKLQSRESEKVSESAAFELYKAETQEEILRERQRKRDYAAAIERQKADNDTAVRIRSQERAQFTKEERHNAEQIAAEAVRQEKEDKLRARQECVDIARANLNQARSRSTSERTKKEQERALREQLDVAEAQRRREEFEERQARQQLLRQELSDDVKMRDSMFKSYSEERARQLHDTQKKQGNNLNRSQHELEGLMKKQKERQIEYRSQLEQQMLEKEQRRREATLSGRDPLF